MINRHIKATKPNNLCKNCRYKKDKDDDRHLNIFTKEEWICLGFDLVDLLDGDVSYYTCRKARKDATLCGLEGKWFKAKP